VFELVDGAHTRQRVLVPLWAWLVTILGYSVYFVVCAFLLCSHTCLCRRFRFSLCADLEHRKFLYRIFLPVRGIALDIRYMRTIYGSDLAIEPAPPEFALSLANFRFYCFSVGWIGKYIYTLRFSHHLTLIPKVGRRWGDIRITLCVQFQRSLFRSSMGRGAG